MPQSWLRNPIRTPSRKARRDAIERLSRLAKPQGSMGVLEQLVLDLASMQGTAIPSVEPARLTVFAADHGVAETGIAAYPSETTVELVNDILQGRGVCSIMAQKAGVDLEVVDVGLKSPPDAHPKLIDQRQGNGTSNFCTLPAMTQHQLSGAMEAGHNAVKRAIDDGIKLLIAGEIGMGDSAVAAAITSALLGLAPETITGPGRGINERIMVRKAEVIQEAILFHEPTLINPQETLRHLGGFEVAALCGTFIACAQHGLPVLVDGFAACTAALVAVSMRPPVKEWLMFAHRSAEPGQHSILNTLGAVPILNLDLRQGEGTGGLAAYPLLAMACAVHRQMPLADHLSAS